MKLCCSRAEPDEADYTLSVCLCHCCIHISSVSLSHTHTQTHTHDFREGEPTCVCACSAICSDEITVVLIESTSDATSRGSRPSKGRHTAAITLHFYFFNNSVILNVSFDFAICYLQLGDERPFLNFCFWFCCFWLFSIVVNTVLACCLEVKGVCKCFRFSKSN